MKQLFKLMVLMLCIISAEKAVAQSSVQKRIQIGPEGDSALYYWKSSGSGGVGYWKLASDSSGPIMESRELGQGYYILKPKGPIKFTKICIGGEEKIFFFDGYWRLLIHREDL